MHEAGINSILTYTVPDIEFLDQAQDHGSLEAEAAREHSGGECQQEVTEIKSALDQAGAEVGEGERFLELGDQDVVQVVGHAPKKEEGHDQGERNY